MNILSISLYLLGFQVDSSTLVKRATILERLPLKWRAVVERISFNPNFRGFDQFDKTANSPLGLKGKNSFLFDPTSL